MNVQADLIHQAGGQERLRQFAPAHEADGLPWLALEIADELDRVACDQLDARIVDLLECAREDVAANGQLLGTTLRFLWIFFSPRRAERPILRRFFGP
jgi:hypothetical protein